MPTVAESGVKDFDVSAWDAIVVPAGTPPAVVARLAAAIDKALDLPETRAQLARQNMEVVKAGPGEFAPFITGEITRWGALLKANNIAID